ncbi:MAG: hypothetical protein IKX40_13675 [Thermoguttaceae bacterium]|nr:hypothetical protein [Thermoguttaceae bacterium]
MSRTKSADEFSRKVREVRKEMEGGNEVREANVVTLCSKGEIPYCVAENAIWMAPVPGGQLDGKSRQGKAETSNNLLNAKSPFVPLVRGRLRPLATQ